jgi:hypothetical protein
MLCKGLGLFNGVVATLLGWLYYSAKGKMYVLGIVVMLMGLMLIFLSLFFKASKSLNHQPEKMAKLQNRRDTNDEI